MKKLLVGLIVFLVGSNVLNRITADLIKEKKLSKIWLIDPFVLYHYIKEEMFRKWAYQKI